MIVILKQDDLQPEYRHQSLDNVQLDHVQLSPELINQAELIVFVEGAHVKFLKHFPEMQSKDSFGVLAHYITSIAPSKIEPTPFSVKRFRRRKKTD